MFCCVRNVGKGSLKMFFVVPSFLKVRYIIKGSMKMLCVSKTVKMSCLPRFSEDVLLATTLPRCPVDQGCVKVPNLSSVF